ncbi:MAG: hypothetical protein WCL54_00980, partial [Clostridia bacterium]
MQKWLKVLIGLYIGLFLILSLFYLFRYDLMGKVSDPSYYQGALKRERFPNNVGLNHFPNTIPDFAQNVKFLFEDSGWIDYTELIILKYRSNQQEIDGLIKKYKTKTIDRFNGDYEVLSKNNNLYELPTEFIYSEAINSLNKDYTVYVLG